MGDKKNARKKKGLFQGGSRGQACGHKKGYLFKKVMSSIRMEWYLPSFSFTPSISPLPFFHRLYLSLRFSKAESSYLCPYG
jgi:hypothetical protein